MASQFLGYMGGSESARSGPVEDGHGKRIGTWNMVSSWKTPKSYVSSRMFQLDVLIDGVWYSARSAGVPMAIAGKRKAAPKTGRNPIRRRGKRELSVPEQHQLRIARRTLEMSDAGALVMGGPTKDEAREIIYRLTGKHATENPHSIRVRQNPTKHKQHEYPWLMSGAEWGRLTQEERYAFAPVSISGAPTSASNYHVLEVMAADRAGKRIPAKVRREYAWHLNLYKPVRRNPRGHYPVERHFADSPGGIWHHGQRHASKEAAVRDLQYYLAQGLNARVAKVSGKDIWQVWYLYDRR